MPNDDTTTGAMPGAGVTPAQAGPTGQPAQPAPTPPAGATPAAGAAGTPPAPTPPAMDDAALGDAGRRAIQAERARAEAAEARAKALEQERDALSEASQSDQEKALTQAKREAAAEERTRWQAHIRRAEVRSALRAAGLTEDKTLALAAGAPEFANLKVTDEGAVEKVSDVVEQFKKDYPAMFAAATNAAPGGAWGGSQGGDREPLPPATLADAVADRLKKRS